MPPGRRPTRTATARRRPRRQGLAHAVRRPAERGLLPRPRHPERALAGLRGLRRQDLGRAPTSRRPAWTLQLADDHSLTYRQVNEEPGRFRITKTYAEDPAHNTLMISVRLESLTGHKLDAYAVYDPALGNDGDDDSGTSASGVLRASDSGSPVASALLAAPAFTARPAATGGPATDGPTSGDATHGLALHERGRTATSCRPARPR